MKLITWQTAHGHAMTNSLVNAPHTADEIMRDDWTHPYSRQVVGNPDGNSQANKYWPPVTGLAIAWGSQPDLHLPANRILDSEAAE